MKTPIAYMVCIDGGDPGPDRTGHDNVYTSTTLALARALELRRDPDNSGATVSIVLLEEARS